MTRDDAARWSAVAGVLAACAWFLPPALAQQADLPIRGVVKAVSQAALSTDAPMRIARLPFREGQRFNAGDILVEFDCRRQRAELEAAGGVVREAELNLASSRSLEKHNAIGRNDVEIAVARLDKARGELKGLRARVEDCVVTAPFSGRVSESSLHELEFTVPQRPFMAIVEEHRKEVEMIVPSSSLAGLKVGQVLVFHVDELAGAGIPIVVSSVAAVVDPVSKTAKVIAAVAQGMPGLLAGMTGTVSARDEAP